MITGLMVIGLMVAGCSSEAGSATPAASTVGGSAASASAVGPASGTASATTLDDQSIAWFDTLCPALSASIGVLGQSGLSDSGTAVQQQAIVAAAQQAGGILATAATQLAAQPAPTFDGGTQVAAGVTAGMNGAAEQLAASATTLAAIDPTDTTALQAGRTAMSQQIAGSLTFLKDLGELDPAVGAEIAKIPSCAEFSQ